MKKQKNNKKLFWMSMPLMGMSIIPIAFASSACTSTKKTPVKDGEQGSTTTDGTKTDNANQGSDNQGNANQGNVEDNSNNSAQTGGTDSQETADANVDQTDSSNSQETTDADSNQNASQTSENQEATKDNTDQTGGGGSQNSTDTNTESDNPEYNEFLKNFENTNKQIDVLHDFGNPDMTKYFVDKYEKFKNLYTEVKNNFDKFNKNKNQWNNTHNGLIQQFKNWAIYNNVKWDENVETLKGGSPYDKLCEKIDEMFTKYEEIANSNEVINSDLKQQFKSDVNRFKTDYELRKEEARGQYEALKQMFYDSFESVYNKSINDFNAKKSQEAEKVANRAEATKEIEAFEYKYPTQDWTNEKKEENLKILDLFAKKWDHFLYGEYFPATATNPSFNEVLNDQELQNVIQKYAEKAKQELLEGRGELGREGMQAKVMLDDSDVDKFTKLVEFNDAYTKIQIQKLNDIRAKMKLPLLNDLSKTLTKRQKVQLILQNILGYEMGILIKDKTPIKSRENSKPYTSGHVINQETKDFMEEARLYYADNYYGPYNNPSYAPESIGPTADFISNTFIFLILGEREAYKKGANIDSDGWGHLLNSLDATNTDFYGAVLMFKDGTQGSETKYRLCIQDMMWKPRNNN